MERSDQDGRMRNGSNLHFSIAKPEKKLNIPQFQRIPIFGESVDDNNGLADNDHFAQYQRAEVLPTRPKSSSGVSRKLSMKGRQITGADNRVIIKVANMFPGDNNNDYNGRYPEARNELIRLNSILDDALRDMRGSDVADHLFSFQTKSSASKTDGNATETTTKEIQTQGYDAILAELIKQAVRKADRMKGIMGRNNGQGNVAPEYTGTRRTASPSTIAPVTDPACCEEDQGLEQVQIDEKKADVTRNRKGSCKINNANSGGGGGSRGGKRFSTSNKYSNNSPTAGSNINHKELARLFAAEDIKSLLESSVDKVASGRIDAENGFENNNNANTGNTDSMRPSDSVNAQPRLDISPESNSIAYSGVSNNTVHILPSVLHIIPTTTWSSSSPGEAAPIRIPVAPKVTFQPISVQPSPMNDSSSSDVSPSLASPSAKFSPTSPSARFAFQFGNTESCPSNGTAETLGLDIGSNNSSIKSGKYANFPCSDSSDQILDSYRTQLPAGDEFQDKPFRSATTPPPQLHDFERNGSVDTLSLVLPEGYANEGQPLQIQHNVEKFVCSNNETDSSKNHAEILSSSYYLDSLAGIKPSEWDHSHKDPQKYRIQPKSEESMSSQNISQLFSQQQEVQEIVDILTQQLQEAQTNLRGLNILIRNQIQGIIAIPK